MQDRYAHGRGNDGERHYRARLTENDIRAAAEKRLAGMTFKQIAEPLGVHSETIRHALRGDTWKRRRVL